ncbi:hypothetical protein Syun_002110 [Stephania yunnanensis]|uniref:Uncharacterized protein n=1 Tax=Stephania yunnanensis TaxID=152371 RepID=A0AAP0LFX8_9MAGN
MAAVGVSVDGEARIGVGIGEVGHGKTDDGCGSSKSLENPFVPPNPGSRE